MSATMQLDESSDERFVRLLGAGRGVEDPAALRITLGDTERELATAHLDIKAARQSAESASAERDEARRLQRETVTQLDFYRFQYDLMRFAYIHAGHDPADVFAAGAVIDTEHHGQFSPNRPYLAGHCVWDEARGVRRCYEARKTVPAGCAPPAHSPDLWAELQAGQEPVYEPVRTPNPLPSLTPMPWRQGKLWFWLLRQDEIWVDVDANVTPVSQLTDEQMQAGLAALDEFADERQEREFYERGVMMPAPAYAYRDALLWMHDTPLYQALAEEKKRRGLRRRPPKKS